MDIMKHPLVYLGWSLSQGSGVHTKIGKTNYLGDRKSSLDTSYSEHGINFEYLIPCETEEEEGEIEEHLQAYFWQDSTTHFENQTGGTEWFKRKYQLEDIKEALTLGGYCNKVISDPNEIEKALEEYKAVYEKEKKEKIDRIEKLKKIIQEKKEKSKEYILRDFQKEILEISNEYYKTHNKGSIIIPCGTGKTVIGSFICRGFNGSRIIIGVPSKILINQWKEKIENILPNHKILVFDSNHDIKDTASLEGNKLVVIITYQSCHKIKGVFDMKIGDECHHLVGENKTEKGFKYFHTIESKKTLFLTATKKIVSCMKKRFFFRVVTLFRIVKGNEYVLFLLISLLI